MGPVDLDMSGKPRTRQNSSSSPSQSLTVTVTSSLTLFGIDFRVGPTTVPNRDSPSVDGVRTAALRLHWQVRPATTVTVPVGTPLSRRARVTWVPQLHLCHRLALTSCTASKSD
jgi:hypothetical protein